MDDKIIFIPKFNDSGYKTCIYNLDIYVKFENQDDWNRTANVTLFEQPIMSDYAKGSAYNFSGVINIQGLKIKKNQSFSPLRLSMTIPTYKTMWRIGTLCSISIQIRINELYLTK